MSLPAEKATALVIRVVDFSESSGVVTLFTREAGKLGALAKGSRKPKGPFESALDLLSYCRVVYLPKPSGQLELLTEAKLERRFRPWSGELPRLYAAYYFAELLNHLTQEHDPHPELFDITIATLEALARHAQGATSAWVLRWELALLRTTGHLPALSECAECGAALPESGRVAFGLQTGGVMCAECRVGQRHLVSVNVRVPRIMQQFVWAGDSQRTEFLHWKELVIPASDFGEIRGVMNHSLAQLLGERPRLHHWMQGITH
jgi:DNA repair protein RecO (recombination protein O)